MMSACFGDFEIVRCQFGDAVDEMLVESSERNLGQKLRTLSARLPLTRSDWPQMMRFCYKHWFPNLPTPSLVLQFEPLFSA